MNGQCLERSRFAGGSGLRVFFFSLVPGALAVVLLLLVLSKSPALSISKDSPVLADLGNTTSVYSDSPINPATLAFRRVASAYGSPTGILSACWALDRSGLNVVLLHDVSGSMNTRDVSDTERLTNTTRLAASQAVVSAFVSYLLSTDQATDQAAVVPYSTTAYVVLALTTGKHEIRDKVNSLIVGGWTSMGKGISVSRALSTSSNPVRAILLFSDGKANCDEDAQCGEDQGHFESGAEYARRQAEAAAKSGIRIYTVGIGADADEKLLWDIAEISGGEYFSFTNGVSAEMLFIAITCRTIYLPLVAKNYCLSTIVNGGFENGWTGWTHGGELSQSITSTNPHSGSYSALLGDPAYECKYGVPYGSAWMEQALRVACTGSPKLSFSYNITTYDMNNSLSNTYDLFEVTINGSRVFADMPEAEWYGCQDPPKSTGWTSATIDLDDYRCSSITIRFANWNRPSWNEDYNTWTYVDDVRTNW